MENFSLFKYSNICFFDSHMLIFFLSLLLTCLNWISFTYTTARTQYETCKCIYILLLLLLFAKKKLQNLYTEFDRERRDDACECFKEQSYPFFFTHKSQLVSQSIVIEISSQKRKIEQVEAKQNEKPIQRRKILYEILLFILFILL